MHAQTWQCVRYFFVLVLLSGCAINRDIRIESEPSGAEVFASSKSLGRTPLLTDIDALFPNRIFDGQFSASRTLVFKKPGYADATVAVTEFSIPSVITLTLTPSGPVLPPKTDTDQVEEKLRKLEKLYQDGLISKEEYEHSRRSILNNL